MATKSEIGQKRTLYDKSGSHNENSSKVQYGQIEKKYHDLYEKIPCLLRSVTLDGIIFACNELYLNKLGYEKNEVIGKSVYEHTANQSMLTLQEEIENWKQTQTISNREIWIKKKDGTIFPVILNGTNLYDESGKLIGRTGVLVDITEISNTKQVIEHEQDVIQRQFGQLRKVHKNLKETEHKYRALYENSPDLLRTINVDGIILDCNNSYCKNMGYTKNEIIGKSVFDFVAPESYDAYVDSFKTWKTSGKVFNKIAWFKRKDGTIFPGLISANNLYDENRKLIGSNTNIRDATEIYAIRKNLEENEKKLQLQNEKLTIAYDHLFELEQRYRTLYEQSPDLVRTIDINETITDCNEKYCTATGYSRDEIVGKSLFEHLAKRSYDDMKQALEEFQCTGHINNREMWIQRKNGSEFPTLLLSTNLYDKDGCLYGRIGNFRDMTEIYSAKKELEEQKTKRLTAIGELSARVAHDLRNPLSILLNTITLIKIKNPDFEKNNKERFERIDRSIKRMSHQIDEVMDYVTPKPLDLANSSLLEIIRSALSNVSTTGVEVQMPENDLSILCDSEKLEIVLTNLILNSVQAMKNSGKIFIRINKEQLEGLNSFAVIEVQDTGAGISNEVLPKVFDPLFTTRQVGTGLGLVSCKSIIEKHSGTISIKTQVGQGTTFIMRIPMPKTTD
ncbi:PAS domain-containing sensor histidine kinase [Candidatus Nitrosotalea bavarica]|uniref:PAS domain-containing sensor histidine kinase n=1 Tax=Candidatus Nitrosotalea bavarica TaxID=1903277 RepID=UPI001054224F|nr:PAS domain-containing sensor histidine kinase [Candidatus Nitrosotalea bavarica]